VCVCVWNFPQHNVSVNYKQKQYIFIHVR